MPDKDLIRATPSTSLRGDVNAPGDKSISHRSMILGALAQGCTRASGVLEGDDVLRTAAAMRMLGAQVERSGGDWLIDGAKWHDPKAALYFGNAGTGSRLVMGAVAGQGVRAQFDGDASLRSRPMGRILDPLALMGAQVESADGKLPCTVKGSALAGIDYTLPKASAQIKSAILLAGLGAEGTTVIHEPEPCRDHTERMLQAFGGTIAVEKEGAGNKIILPGRQRLVAATVKVPGDPSSAAFLVAAGLLVPGSVVTVRSVLMNPLRTGFYQTIKEMGADLVLQNERTESGEPVADLTVRASRLRGVTVPAERAASMIDEYPVLSVLAAFADGETCMEGVEELRVKESDRIAAMERGLEACGVQTASGADWFTVIGSGRPKGGAVVQSHHDHRIAMSFLVLGLGADEPVSVTDGAMIATSFPGFEALMQALGAKIA